VHLIPDTTTEIKESFKLTVNGEQSISHLHQDVLKHLDSRNDGNKIYSIREV